jgi:hypothetical protein
VARIPTIHKITKAPKATNIGPTIENHNVIRYPHISKGPSWFSFILRENLAGSLLVNKNVDHLMRLDYKTLQGAHGKSGPMCTRRSWRPKIELGILSQRDPPTILIPREIPEDLRSLWVLGERLCDWVKDKYD